MALSGGNPIADRPGRGMATRREPGERVRIPDEGEGHGGNPWPSMGIPDPAARGLRRGRVACGRDATPGMAAARGIRRLWKRVPDHAEMRGFEKPLVDQMSNGQI